MRRPLLLLPLLAAAALLPAVTVVANSHGDGGPAGVGALPALGVADGETTIFGAVSEGSGADETWAYRRLPADVAPPPSAGADAAFGPLGSSFRPQLAFLRHTDASGWRIVSTPVGLGGTPERGPAPNFRSARMSARGAAVLVGRDGGRPADQQVVVLRRDPGGRFRELPAPPADVLLGADDPAPGDAAEQLAGDRGSGRVNTAIADGPDKALLFDVPVGRDVEGAVLVHDGGEDAAAWQREPILLPDAPAEFTVAGIAAVAPGRAYLVATSPGKPLRLFHRVTGDASPEWQEITLPVGLLTDPAAAQSAGIDGTAPLAGRAQTITATADGVWIDVKLTAGTTTTAGTVFVRPDAPETDRVESWCSAPGCDHPFEAILPETAGYRSFAWAGTGAGTRVITNPWRVGGDEQSGQGTYLSLRGTTFARLPGGGWTQQPGGAFRSADRGWLGGPVEVGDVAEPERLRRWPVAMRSPLLGVAGAPGAAAGDAGAGALAVGWNGAVARFTPGQGWSPEYLQSSNGNVVKSNLRGVAWPEPERAHAVGDGGALWLWRSDTGLWERDPATPVGFIGDATAIAFDAADPQRGYIAGKQGFILRYDKTWTQETLPAGFADARFTSVAFAGRQAIAVSDKGVLVNGGDGWKPDEGLKALLAGLGKDAGVQLTIAAGLPDGGAVIGGRDLVVERDGPSTAWRFADQPLPGQTVVAAAAVRDGEHVRAVVSVQPKLLWPQPDVPVETDPNSPTPILPSYPPPGDGYVLRETAGGWADEQRTAFGGSGADRPVKSDPVLAFDLGAGGAGWAVGGWTGQPDSAGRGIAATGAVGNAARATVSTTGIYRYDPGQTALAPANEAPAPVSLAPGPVRLAFGAHAQCAGRCADLANQDLAPDRILTAALDQAAALAAQPNGPRAFLYGGGRVAAGAAGDADEEARYAQLLGSRASLPVFGTASATDVAGGSAGAFRSAFAGAPAPFGSAAVPGIGTDGIPGAPAGNGARTHYAFDTAGAGGTVRVVAIDNSGGSLAASDPWQNPAEPQRPWLIAVLDDAAAKGIPAIVVGSRDLNPRARPALNVAQDGDEVAQLLVDHGASAYFFDRPEENRTGQVPAGATATIPEFGSGTLGYRSSVENAAGLGLPDALFGDSGFLLVEVNASARDPKTNRAPVNVRLIPVIDGVSLQAIDGSLLRRSRPALFQGLLRKPIAGDRWGPSGGDGLPDPAGADPYTTVPPDPCLVAGCTTRITPEYAFSSKDPDILDFVAQDPNSANLRKPLLGADDKVISDGTSGLVCPFNAGSTVVTVSAGGRAFSQNVTVLPGTVQRPCGTRPLSPDKIKRQAAPASAPATPPPPAGAPASNPLPALVPPPPPATPAPKPATPRPQPQAPFFAGLLATAPPLVAQPPVTPPPPPPSFFANPIPPGGATVRVHEEKREEEIAPESSQASAVAYRADDHLPLAPFIVGIAVIAALAGISLRLPRRRDPAYSLTRTRFPEPRDPRFRRR